MQTDESRLACVDAAVAELEHILRGNRGPPPAAPAAISRHSASIAPPPNIYSNVLPASNFQPPLTAFPSMSAPAPGMHPQPMQLPMPTAHAPQAFTQPATTPLMVIVNTPPAPPEFNLVEKIRGQGGSFLAHIMRQTGSSVVLQGQGSATAEGPDPLHLIVSGPAMKGIEEAKALALDLLKTVKESMAQQYPHLAQAAMVPCSVCLAPPHLIAYTPPAQANPYSAYAQPQVQAPAMPVPNPYAMPNPYAQPGNPGPFMPAVPSGAGYTPPPQAIASNLPTEYQQPGQHAPSQPAQYAQSQPLQQLQSPYYTPPGAYPTPPGPQGSLALPPQEGGGYFQAPAQPPKRKFSEAPVKQQSFPAATPEPSPAAPSAAAHNPYAQYLSNSNDGMGMGSQPSYQQPAPAPVDNSFLMPPPPARAPSQSAEPSDDSGAANVVGSLAGLVDY
eukprot:gene22466-29583_t